MQVSVRTNIADVARQLSHLQKSQIPFATSLALTKIAPAVKAELQAEMGRVFDRPTRYTMGSVFSLVRKTVAEIWLKDRGSGTPAGKYLLPQIIGGRRRQKRFERALEASGNLPRGWVVVPGAGTKLDAHGNISGAQIVQILSALRAFSNVGFSANRTARSRARRKSKLRDLFVSGPINAAPAANGGRLPFGVWERKGGRIINILFFVRSATYGVRFNFYPVAKRVVDRRWNEYFDAALRHATRTQGLSREQTREYFAGITDFLS
jgi:hypothetical protein